MDSDPRRSGSTPEEPSGPSLQPGPPLDEPREYRRQVDEHPAATINLVAQLAEDWGGLWQPEGALRGRLGIPVSAGLRRGWVAGPLEAAHDPDRRGEEATLLVFRAEVGEYRVDRAAVAVLMIAGLAGIAAMLAPFVPALLGFLPLGMILGLAAWLMVIARLRNSGPDEFLEQVGAGPGPEASPETGPETGPGTGPGAPAGH